jgi:hypothetical protein
MLYYSSNVERQPVVESQSVVESRSNVETNEINSEIKNLKEAFNSLLKKSKRVDYNLVSDIFLPSETNEILQRILILLYIILIIVFVKFFIIK